MVIERTTIFSTIDGIMDIYPDDRTFTKEEVRGLMKLLTKQAVGITKDIFDATVEHILGEKEKESKG